MTAAVVLACAVILIVVASLAIHYRDEAAELPEWDDLHAHDAQRAALARATRPQQPTRGNTP